MTNIPQSITLTCDPDDLWAALNRAGVFARDAGYHHKDSAVVHLIAYSVDLDEKLGVLYVVGHSQETGASRTILDCTYDAPFGAQAYVTLKVADLLAYLKNLGTARGATNLRPAMRATKSDSKLNPTYRGSNGSMRTKGDLTYTRRAPRLNTSDWSAKRKTRLDTELRRVSIEIGTASPYGENVITIKPVTDEPLIKVEIGKGKRILYTTAAHAKELKNAVAYPDQPLEPLILKQAQYKHSTRREILADIFKGKNKAYWRKPETFLPRFQIKYHLPDTAILQLPAPDQETYSLNSAKSARYVYENTHIFATWTDYRCHVYHEGRPTIGTIISPGGSCRRHISIVQLLRTRRHPGNVIQF